jgi:hypothetical protein
VTNQRTSQFWLPPETAWTEAYASIAACVFPTYTVGSLTVFTRLSTLEAVQRLFSDRIFLGFPLTRRAVERFLRWIETIPCFELISTDLKEGQRCLETLWV